MKFTICASGNLGYIVLRHLVNNSIDISLVLTDFKSNSIIEFCENHEIPVFKGNPRQGKFIKWITDNPIQIVHLLSVNYLFILDNEILDKINGYAINFHGSLLPKYRGRTPHVWAIINGEKECGITAHLMNSKCDDGDIIKQIVVNIDNIDTGADILNKYNALYPSFVLSIIESIRNNTLTFTHQDISKATYFSKRTPADVEINWDWQKERIYNWVRAQADPYPGAFTYLNDKKFIINHIFYADYGFIDSMPNGQIVAITDGNPIVKTQNGCICIDNFNTNAKFTIGDIFGGKYIVSQSPTPPHICNEELKVLWQNNSLESLDHALRSETEIRFVNYIECDIAQLIEILELRNHPEIRKWMVNSDEILFDKHINFVQSLLTKSDSRYYAVYMNDKLYASINIQVQSNNICERGIYSAPEFQGHGYTSKLERTFNKVLKSIGFNTILAKVKLDNQRSIRYHNKLGYKEVNRNEYYSFFKLEL
jgi:methionyl-tRNA formyltransferase/RimJ/RimL family protein N-acetyltransferase